MRVTETNWVKFGEDGMDSGECIRGAFMGIAAVVVSIERAVSTGASR